MSQISPIPEPEETVTQGDRSQGKFPIWSLILVLVVLVGARMAWQEHRKTQAVKCSSQLWNYNSALGSCGVDNSCTEAWADPVKSEALVLKLFGETLPKCPLGGTCHIVCNDPYGRGCSYAVCSLEGKSGGHQDGYTAREIAANRAKRLGKAP